MPGARAGRLPLHSISQVGLRATIRANRPAGAGDSTSVEPKPGCKLAGVPMGASFNGSAVWPTALMATPFGSVCFTMC